MREFLRYLFVVAAMLMVVVGDAWAWRGAKIHVYSQPTDCGYVYANTSNSGSASNLTYDYADKSEDKTGKTTYSFYLFNLPKPGYKFMGYSDNKSATTGITTTNKFDIECGTAWWGNYTEETYYAIFAPITYTVAFNGNGSTSGTMANMSMVYNAPKTLIANAFARQYTVAYNADGGTSSVPSAVADYTFVGWEDHNSMAYNGTTYSYAEFDAPYYANTYADLYAAFGYNKYNLLQHYINNGKGEGRSPKGSVPGVYPNNANVSNLTTISNATVTLYAQWQSASVTLPNATKAGAVIDGWYDGNVKVGEPGDSYTPTANVTLTAKWIEKYTPEFSGNNYALFVDREQANAFTFKYTSNPTVHIEVVSISNVNNGSGKVISYDAVNNKIIAHNAGVAEIYFTQAETETIKAGTSAAYTITISKHQTSFGGEAYSMMVDGTQIANYSYANTSSAQPTSLSSDDFYYTIDNVVFANEALNNGTDLVIFNPSTKQITACNAGSAKITLHQKETYKYTGATASYNVIVEKYTPTFTWNAGEAKYYYLSSINNIFSTTNIDFGYTIVSDNEHVARVIDNTLYIYNVEETANITVTQVENYKWNGRTEIYTINPVEVNNHVTFTYTQEMFNDGTITTEKVAGNSCSWDGNGVKLESDATNWDDKYVVISFKGVPKDISFKYKASTENVSNGWTEYRQADWYVAQSEDGKNWSNVWENSGGDKSNSTSLVTISAQTLSPTSRYIKLCYSGNYAGYYSEVVVTELEAFQAIPDIVDFGTKGLNYGEQDTLITFNHANAGRETKVEIKGTDSNYFTVTPTVIPNTGRDQYGTTYLKITFDNKKENRGEQSYNAELYIYDNTGHEEIVPLIGKRFGKSYPTFKWNPNGLPYYIETTIANIATSSNTDKNCPLSYTSSNPSVAEVKDGVLHIYNKEQEVTITVSQSGNNDFYDSSAEFTFTPRKKPDLVVPFYVTNDIYNKAVNPVYFCSWNESEAAIQVGKNSGVFEDPAWDWDAKTALIIFDNAPDKLSFKYKAINGNSTGAYWKVEESEDGVTWNPVFDKESNSTTYQEASEIQLKETTRYLRFSFSGNFGGYFKDINVSELVGYKYLRAADGQYLSRGAKWGTQAVIDHFGVVSRITRYTADNANFYTRFFFVDSEQYMFETETEDELRLHEIFTDNGTANNSNQFWQINNNGGILTIQSANDVGVSHRGNYITAVNGVLAFTTNEAKATKWQMEDYTEHPQYIADMLNRQAAEAALKDFGEEINTLEKVRNRLKVEDFETCEIAIQPLALGEQTGEGRTIEGMPHIYEQTITGLDTGFYRLTVKALYRISNSEIAWKCNQEKGKESVLAYAYANDVQYPIQSVYASYHSSAIENTDEWRDGKYYSTTLSSANVAFNDVNRYLNDVYVYVEADPGKTTGTLRYGIKCPSYVPGAWLAYSTIALTYFGRKEYVFVGNDSEEPTDWQRAGNWKAGTLPGEYHNVRIEADVNIYQPIEVYGISVVEGKKIHITSRGGLTVGKGGIVVGAKDSIIIDNTPEGAGFLRVDPTTDNKPAKVTVKYTTRTYDNGSPRNEVWQYLGMPGANGQISSLEGVSMYHWKETSGWIQKSAADLQNIPAWDGYAFTQSKEEDATFQINVEPILENKEIHFTCTPKGMNGDNLFVNSYLAPIDVTKIDEADIVDSQNNLVRTFFIFNSGSWNDWNAGAGDITASDYDQSSPGHYYSIPFFSAKLIDDGTTQVVIPSMQGVYVYSAGASSIKLDYNKHVLGANAKDMHKPMRAPQYQMEDESFRRVRIQASSENSGADRMYIVQEKNTTPEYDNGYDGDNIIATGQVNIYTHEPFGQMEVSCSNHIDSMLIGFTAGEDSIYTLTFGAVVGEDMYLLDLQTDSLMHLSDGQQYSFSAQPNSVDNMRFQLVIIPNSSDSEQPNEGDVTTNVDNVSGTACVWVKDNIVYVMDAPYNSSLSVYSVSGICIQAPYIIHQAPCTIDLSHLPTGVYVLKLNDKAFKIVCD